MKRTLSVISLLLLLSACSARQAAPVEKMRVAASFYPLAFLAEQIGGEHVTVAQITPAGVEPHDYEPSPQQIAAVHDAKVFLFNGAGVDPWAEKVRGELSQKPIVVVEMVDHFTLLEGGHDEHEEEEGEEHVEEEEHEGEANDPHIWLDPVNMKQEALLVRDALIQADSANAETYRQNADALVAQLDTLHASFQSGLANCSVRQAVVSHNAFRYLANRYKFETLALAGLSPEEEPSPQKMAEIAGIVKEKSIKYIFFETLVSPKLSETIAREVGAESLVLNPIEGLTADDTTKGNDYLSVMQQNLENLRTAMQCQ